MKLTIVALCLFLVSIPSWAGTFRDDFEDGNWQGWEPFRGRRYQNSIDVERFSVVDGVFRIDGIVGSTDFSGHEIGVCLLRHWEDYSFSADVRIVEVDPGH